MASISIEPRKLSEKSATLSPTGLYIAIGATSILLLSVLWFAMALPVVVTVDGVEQNLITHRRTVDGVLRDLGITVVSIDRVSPAPTARLRARQSIVVERSRPFRLLIDGRIVDVHSWGETVGDVLADSEFVVDLYDLVYLNGEPVALTSPIGEYAQANVAGELNTNASQEREQIPSTLQVVRSVPLTVNDGGMSFVVKTTAQTVGEALREAEITIYLGDRVDPSLGSPVTTGLKVQIQRSQPAQVHVDGQVIRTRTQAATVAEALSEMRIGLSGLDEVNPALDTLIADGQPIQITRVREEVEVTEEIAPFDTVFVADANIPIDTQEVTSPGAEGITRTRYRVRYENGQEVSRLLEDTWIAQEPANRTIAYGQRIEPRTFTAPDGTTITYWRKIHMSATSYSAGTAGVAPTRPNYGRTYTGDVMRHGIVAVDPSVIPLRSQVYVPGYGIGDALDTGGAIRSRRIDLGYDDSNLELWSSWVDVYLLWPPPPSHQITWVIPNWPRSPQ